MVSGTGERLVTLVGPAGVGKSRLAIAIAAEVAAEVAHVDLSVEAISRPVLQVIAGALGVRPVAEAFAASALVAHLTGRRVILVLDHVDGLPPGSEIDGLLAACPELIILATGREPLRARREHVVPVAPLALPDPDISDLAGALPDIAAMPAIDLFVRRARAADPRFALDGSSVAAVVALCARLDGLPLAIELVAPRAALMSPQAVLDRDHHLGALPERSPGDAPARHQTLDALFAWSDARLEPHLRTVFHRLGIFAGEFPVSAIDAVTGSSSLGLDGWQVVTELAERSLVRVRSVTTDDEPRVSLLQTTRAYARARLAATGELPALERCHAAYWLDLAERAHDALLHHGQRGWMATLEGGHVDLLAAMDWSLTHDEEGSDGALRLATSLWYFWWVRGHLAEGSRLLGAALDRSPDAPASRRATATTAMGMLVLWQGDLEEAVRLLTGGLHLARSAGDAPGEAFALTSLGVAAWRRGDIPGGAALHAAALKRALDHGDGWHAAMARIHLGMAAHLLGDGRRARTLLAEAVDGFRALGEPHLPFALAALAVSEAAEDRGRAVAHITEALALCRSRPDRGAVAFVTATAASLLAGWGSHGAAARLLGFAAAHAGATGWVPTPFEADATALAESRGRGAMGAGEWDDARDEGRRSRPDAILVEAKAALAAIGAESGQAGRASGSAVALSPRQREVLGLVAAGLSNREIAARLAITERTATFHVTAILNKLGAGNRAQAVALAASQGLLEITRH